MQDKMLNPTRTNLIALKKRLAIVEKGDEILTHKRQALVSEFMKLLSEPRKRRHELENMLQQGYKRVMIGNAYIGNFELNQMAYYVKEASPVSIEIRNVMGVRVPEISTTRPGEFQAPFGASLAVDEINKAFTVILQAMIDVAEMEHGLRTVVIELEKTKKQINTLEDVVMPQVSANIKYIQMRIDEMDRDMFVALKHVKNRLAKSKHGA
ncbi:MAG: V-type ATP synthase subunit D [Candidatus Micrarchaeia archaeon]